ncbi:GNAT family N-acetyltransferase [Modestobacter sp. VKM Ac-2983]|uniref:GNAT family N-acetyltransferase n=1 Tax=Modestobacter sp. VKM Ac-2983 TaxID=3004137 RepID=UPI003FA57B90
MQEKVRAVDALMVVVREGSNVVAMALAEPGRSDDGGRGITPGHGPVSMVFVAPERWGRGIGRALMTGLHQYATARGWTTTTLWI